MIINFEAGYHGGRLQALNIWTEFAAQKLVTLNFLNP